MNVRRKAANEKMYDQFMLYIPAEVARDSGFPFKPGDVLVIRVDPQRKRVTLERASGRTPT